MLKKNFGTEKKRTGPAGFEPDKWKSNLKHVILSHKHLDPRSPKPLRILTQTSKPRMLKLETHSKPLDPRSPKPLRILESRPRQESRVDLLLPSTRKSKGNREGRRVKILSKLSGKLREKGKRARTRPSREKVVKELEVGSTEWYHRIHDGELKGGQVEAVVPDWVTSLVRTQEFYCINSINVQ